MTINCAWCGRHLGDDSRLPRVSHGICADCEKVNFPEPATFVAWEDPDGA
jgi:hypothetical protein